MLLILGIALVVHWRTRKGRQALRAAVEDGPEGEPYRIYTTEFDQVVSCDDVVASLASSSPDEAAGLLEGKDAWLDAIAGSRALPDGSFDSMTLVDEGVEALLSDSRWPNPDLDIALTVLVDQSGSMRGPRIAAVAQTVSNLSEYAYSNGPFVEVLGFSTAGWHGGFAYRKWKEDGRPPRPGRVCALRHIIYTQSDCPGMSEYAEEVMLHPALLRENVDGEALAWAASRLLERDEPRKLLLVISDGAPADDATLLLNGPNYLWRHFVQTVREIEANPALIVGAVLIGDDSETPYSLAERAQGPDDIPRALGEMLRKMAAC